MTIFDRYRGQENSLPANQHAAHLSVRMGAVGSCQLGDEDGVLALCAYDQIWKKYQGSKPALLDTDYDKLPLTVEGQTTRLRRDLTVLKVMLRDLAAGKEELKLLEAATRKNEYLRCKALYVRKITR